MTPALPEPLERLSRAIDGRSTWRLFLVTFVVMNIARYLIMPWVSAQLGATGWPKPLDLSFAYSPEDAFARVAAYGEIGRARFPIFSFTGDLVYPVAYTACFAALLSLLARPLVGTWALAMKLNLLPVAVFMLDIFENLSIAVMMHIYPATPLALGLAASIFTTGKWLFAGLAISSALVLGARRLMQAARH